MNARVLLLAVLASSACAPQNATLTSGSYTAFLSVNTSPAFVGDQIRVEDIGASGRLWSIDCRELLNLDDRLEGAIDICSEEGGGIEVARSGGSTRVFHEQWIDRDAYRVASEPLDPWRGEAVITSENDLQLTFHHRLPGSDFRFAFVLDPAFQPRRCEQQEDGSLSLEPIDGDWVANWSRAINTPNWEGGEVFFPGEGEDGTLFLLNAQSYQFNPAETQQTWNLPPPLEAGYARATWGPEVMFAQASSYGEPAAYLQYDLDDRQGPPATQIWYTDLDPDEFTGEDFEQDIRTNSAFRTLMRDVEGTALETQEELATFGIDDPGSMRPMVPSNAWRRPDGFTAGFDGWGEMHYSWVRLDQSRQEIEVGADLSGEFALWFYGANSQSRLLVNGSFEVDGVKRDRWTTPNVQEDKLEENDTNLCGVQYGDDE